MNAAALFRCLSHGVYVVGVTDGQTCNAFTAAWLMQASFDPPLLVLSINPAHRSCRLLEAGGVYSVNVLREGQTALAEIMGRGQDSGKMEQVAWHRGATQAPLLDDALATLECRVTAMYPAGDHRLAVGRVVAGAVLQPGGRPLLYREVQELDGSAGLYVLPGAGSA